MSRKDKRIALDSRPRLDTLAFVPAALTAQVNDAYDAKLAGLEDKLAKAQRELQADETEYNQRKFEELGKGLENFIGLFGRRRTSLSSSLTKHRLTEASKSRFEQSRQVVEDLKDQLGALDQERQSSLQQVNDRWAELVDDVSEVPLTPQKKDVFLDLFGVIWLLWPVQSIVALVGGMIVYPISLIVLRAIGPEERSMLARLRGRGETASS